MPLSMRFNHGAQQEYTEGKKMPNVCGAPGDISLLILCQLKLMMVREETAEAEGPCNYYFLEPSEVQDPL